MDKIGNAMDARLIRNVFNDYQTSSEVNACTPESCPLPDGWSYVSSGAFRSVFRSPDGVGYKVERKRHKRDSSDNLREYNASIRIRKECVEIPGVRIPEMTYYELDNNDPVIAVEFIDGKTLYGHGDPDGKYQPLIERLETEWRIWDTHGFNLMVDKDESLVLVDISI